MPGPDRALPSASQLAKLSDGKLMAELAATADELDTVGAREKALWAHRLAIYLEGRKRSPAVTQQQLAQVARVSEVAIAKAFKKHETRQAEKG